MSDHHWVLGYPNGGKISEIACGPSFPNGMFSVMGTILSDCLFYPLETKPLEKDENRGEEDKAKRATG
jgi:hypothetical protein